MTTKRVWASVVMGSIGTMLLGCSTGAAGHNGSSGAMGGHAGAADVELGAADLADLAGGSAPEDTAAEGGAPSQPCVTPESCDDDKLRRDTSPWIVYRADDDTPGVSEAYALKRDLVGQMEPIKLNDPLEPGWDAKGGGGWAPDHQLYTFSIRQRSPYRNVIELVYFGDGLPRKAQRLDGEDLGATA